MYFIFIQILITRSICLYSMLKIYFESLFEKCHVKIIIRFTEIKKKLLKKLILKFPQKLLEEICMKCRFFFLEKCNLHSPLCLNNTKSGFETVEPVIEKNKRFHVLENVCFNGHLDSIFIFDICVCLKYWWWVTFNNGSSQKIHPALNVLN